MGKMKELFLQYQEEMRGQDEIINDETHFQKWVEDKTQAWINSLPSVSNPSHITHSIFTTDTKAG